MFQHIRPAATLLLLFTLLTGIAYPLAITGAAQLVAPFQANGSLISRGAAIIGSDLIGQNFTSERYFHPRPSATNTPDPADASKTVDAPYNAANSSGSNLGPLSKALVDRVTADADQWRGAGGAGARNLPEDRVRSLVASVAEGRLFGLLGEPRVNVLRANLALDRMKKT